MEGAGADEKRLISRASSSSTLIVPKVRSMRDGHSTLGHDDEAVVDPPAHGRPRDEGLSQAGGNGQAEAVVEAALIRPAQQPPLHFPTLPHISPHDNRILPPIRGVSPHRGHPQGTRAGRFRATVVAGPALQRALPNTCSRPRDELLFPSMPATALRHLDRPTPAPPPAPRLRPVPAAHGAGGCRARARSPSTRSAWWPASCSPRVASAPAGAGVVAFQVELAGVAAVVGGLAAARARAVAAPPCAPAPPVTHASAPPFHSGGPG